MMQVTGECRSFSQQKPRRGNHLTSKACDLCRATKKKCDWKPETATCSLCRKRGSLCIFNYVRKGEGYRSRLSEDALREKPGASRTFSGLEAPSDGIRFSNSIFEIPSSGITTMNDQDGNLAHPYSNVQLLDDPRHHWSIPESRVMDPSFDLMESSEMINEPNASQEILSDTLFHTESPFDKAFGTGVSPCSEYTIQEIWILLQEYLEDFNRAIPLFQDSWVTDAFYQIFEDQQNISLGSNLCFHLMIAIAYRLRAQSPLSSDTDDMRANQFLKYVSSRIGDLLLERPSLQQAQCLMGVVVIVEGTGAPERTCALLSAALRILDQLCKDTSNDDTGNELTSEVQINQVWLIGMLIDSSICLRNDMQPTISLEVAESYLLRLASLTEDNVKLNGIIRSTDGEKVINIFQAHIELSMLQLRVLKSPSPSPSSSSEDLLQGLSDRALILEQSFRSWRSSFFCPVIISEIRATFHRSDIVHLVILEAKAFETICAIHGISKNRLPALSQIKSWKRLLSPIVVAAKRILQLLALAPRGDITCSHLTGDASVLASFILLTFVVQSPLRLDSQFNLRLARYTISQAQALHEKKTNEPLPSSIKACLWLESISHKLVNKGLGILEKAGTPH